MQQIRNGTVEYFNQNGGVDESQSVTRFYSCWVCTFMTSSKDEITKHKENEHDIVQAAKEDVSDQEKPMKKLEVISQKQMKTMAGNIKKQIVTMEMIMKKQMKKQK